jgi:hypothetical protein
VVVSPSLKIGISAGEGAQQEIQFMLELIL